MNIKIFTVILIGLLTLFSSEVKADDKQELCGFYGNIGRSVTEFVLPLTIQQMVGMNSGNDPKLQKELEGNLLTYVTNNQLAAFAKLPKNQMDALGESAGQNGVVLLMEAKARSSMEVYNILETRCNRVGPYKLIENQIEAGKLSRGEK